MTYTAEQKIAKYVEIRDKRDALSEKHKLEMEPINKALDVLEASLMDDLNAMGGDSIKTPVGTAYRSTIMTVKVEDWDSFQYWNTRFGGPEFLVRQVNKTEVKAAMEDGRGCPAGLKIDTIHNLNVRRA